MEKNDLNAVNDTQELEAGLEAASDSSAQENLNDENINDQLSYVIGLSKTYDFEGQEISGVDLSGLNDLTTADAEHVERVMSKLKHHPVDKFRDYIYTKHIAMRVTGLPIEFFNQLKWKDMDSLRSRIAVYFLL